MMSYYTCICICKSIFIINIVVIIDSVLDGGRINEALKMAGLVSIHNMYINMSISVL